LPVSPSHIRQSIETLSATPRNSHENPEQHLEAANWIANEFEKLGLAVVRQEFEIPNQSPPRTGSNIVASLNSSSNAPSVLIGAHYDTVPGSPGADDNASGVAAMIECARVLVEANSSRTVIFAAFDAEEMQPPVEGLHGSTAFVAGLSSNNRPSAAIILESIGFSSTTLKQTLPGSFRVLFRRAYKALKRQKFAANSLLILSKRDSRQISRTLEHTAAQPAIALPILPLEVPWWMPLVRNLRRSDHAPFWKAGIPAVMISDTANFRNPHYHRSSDTADTIDIELVAQATRTIVTAIDSREI
jgi:Zn-dependent M28 family amino/carboxypeptidase